MTAPSGTKLVFDFSEGSREMRDLLGGKGANVADMTRLGLPVPPGFTITTEACIAYLHGGRRLPDGLAGQVTAHLARLEERAGRRLGDARDPLLVSVRSGARFSMPGMMDTVLNLGLTDRAVAGLATRTANPRFAFDSYRRFIQMYGDVVCGVDKHHFERALDRLKAARGAASDVDLTADDLGELVATFKGIFREHRGEDFPQDPRTQLDGAIVAVFESWENRRANDYRRLNGIPHHLGTAVNVQQMVFGNTGPRSATGVAFTRNNVTGEPGRPFGDFLVNAQGEDVVAGIRTPEPLEHLRAVLPDAYGQLLDTMRMLERSYRDMQDVEFTIEDGRLYMLQTRNGKRSAQAMARIAVDLVTEGLRTRAEALRDLVDPNQVRQLLLPQIDPATTAQPVAVGVNASPGAAAGKVVFSADEAERLGGRGERVLLVREETTPDDLHGMIAAQGILTARGGKTSHAAIVAVGMGKPAVCGVGSLVVGDGELAIDGLRVGEGDMVTIDGTTGRVYVGEVPLVAAQADNPYLLEILRWADQVRRLRVLANADTPDDARAARALGAEGIGLCRTEHMFFSEERIPIVERMIMARGDLERDAAIDELRPFQEADFEGIFRAMAGLPVTIRLLDPPLHEFLPRLVDLSLAAERLRLEGRPDAALEAKLARATDLQEVNPMLGQRGCRLGIEVPRLYQMQVEAIMSAACTVAAELGDPPLVEIMVPLVGFASELRLMRALIVQAADGVLAERGVTVPYTVGSMIEVPRAALTADEIVAHADFLSFGTNDLTQTTLAFSRDDAEGSFLPHYLQRNLLPANPFETLDQTGVGKLLRAAAELARGARPGVRLGVCGEHGGDPESVRFFHGAGLDYVSCSPFRIQVARIAAGQAAIGA